MEQLRTCDRERSLSLDSLETSDDHGADSCDYMTYLDSEDVPHARERDLAARRFSGMPLDDVPSVIEDLDEKLRRIDAILNWDLSEKTPAPSSNTPNRKAAWVKRDDCLSPIPEVSSDDETGFFGSSDELRCEHF